MVELAKIAKNDVKLTKITKNDAKEAAMMFLGILAMWTDCFFDGKAGARLLKFGSDDKEESYKSYEGGDIHYQCAPPEVLEQYIAQSDLENAVFVRRIVEVLDFAQTGTWNGTDSVNDTKYFDAWLSEAVTEFSAFRFVFKNDTILSFKDSDPNMLDSVNQKGDRIINILFAVVDAAYARWKLLEGFNLTLDEIALLAGVDIKTVRNALSSKGHDRLIICGREEDKTVVDPDEAYRWLLTKKGFTGPFLYTEEPPYDTYETLGQFRHHCFVLRKLANLEITDLAKQLNWDKALTDAYMHLENLAAAEALKLLTPKVLLELGRFYQSKHINTFVVEGSRIIASVVAEIEAKALFN